MGLAGTFIMFVLAVVMWRLGIIRYNIEGRRGVAKVEKTVFAKAMKLPMSYYEEHHSGDFIARLTFDMERAGDIYSSRLRRFADAIIASLAYLFFMVMDSPQLTGCLLAISFLSLLGNSLFLKPMKNAGARLARQNGYMTEHLTNLLSRMELAPCGKDGHNSTLDHMRNLIAYVPQEPYLYSVTIAENIAYGRPDVRPEEMPMEDIVKGELTL